MKTELLTPKVVDFLEIKDVDSGEVLVRQRGQFIDGVEAEKLRAYLARPYDGGSDNHGS
jgi:hypothetical protein